MAKDLKFLLIGQDKSASKTLRKVGDEADKTRSKFAGMAGALAGGAVTAGIISFGKASVQAFTEAQAAQEKLTFAFAKFPKTADISIDALREYNSALAKKTKFDDDAIASAQAVIAQFGLTGKQIKETTPILLDFAAATGRDLPSAAEVLGKAMMGNAKALKDIGIKYKTTGNSAQDYINIQALVSAKVGGFAENEGKTAAGQLAILQNQFGEVQEEVGMRLLPVLTNLGKKLLSTIDFVQRNSGAVKVLVVTLGTLGAAVYAVNTAMRVATATTAALTAVQTVLTRSTATQGVAATGTAVSTSAMSAAQVRAAITGTSLGVASAGATGGIYAMGAAVTSVLGPLAAGAAAALLFINYLKRVDASVSNTKSTIAGLPTATIGSGNGFDSKGQPTGKPKPANAPVVTFAPQAPAGTPKTGKKLPKVQMANSVVSDQPIVLMLDGKVVAQSTRSQFIAAQSRGANLVFTK